MAEEQPQPPSTTTNNHPHSNLITSFTEITSSSIEEATFFLKSHNFDLDSALSTIFETTTTVPTSHRNPNSQQNDVNDDVNSPASSSPSRSRSVSNLNWPQFTSPSNCLSISRRLTLQPFSLQEEPKK
ncbi:plant UBX domain-containing protein 5 [Tanacetum coccineum]